MSFAERRDAVLAEIAAACARHGRDPADVALLPVSKTKPADAVREAMACGQEVFGENRVQELVAKSEEVEGARWHLIGSLQTNKINALLRVPRLELVHSVDRESLAEGLEKRLAENDRVLPVLLQVDATGEASKHGVPIDAATALADAVRERCPHLELRGLMGIGPLAGEPGPVFARIAALRDALRERLDLPLPVLSLGMSGDLDAAIAAGSTLVRVGTALFGARS